MTETDKLKAIPEYDTQEKKETNVPVDKPNSIKPIKEKVATYLTVTVKLDERWLLWTRKYKHLDPDTYFKGQMQSFMGWLGTVVKVVVK